MKITKADIDNYTWELLGTGINVPDPSRIMNIAMTTGIMPLDSLKQPTRQQRILKIHDTALNSGLEDKLVVTLFKLSYSGLDDDLVLAEEIIKTYANTI